MSNNKLYIQLFSIHGLVRGNNIQFGHNADTGGQVKYLIELAKTLAGHKDVRKVDLFTRLIRDKTVSQDYARPIENLDKNVRIVRIQCGGYQYIRKEMLWPHLDEFVDKTLKFIKDESDIPDIIHGHYCDGGYVAMELARFFGVPLVFTGHSLGRVKKSNLVEVGVSDEDIDRKLNMTRRIEVEELLAARSEKIIASTNQEVKQQWGMYDAAHLGNFCVIPPGIELDRFFPFFDEPESEDKDKIKQARYFLEQELKRFWVNPQKPFILALARPDKHKNMATLVTAYGNDKELQAIANLAIFAGIRKDISQMDDNEREVLTELLLLMDKYDLYGKMAIPKHHEVRYEVPELYRIVGRHGGVFINPAFKENFGLTLIEAAASGVPVVATNFGGPEDIVANLKHGILVDVNDHRKMSDALKKIITDQGLWKSFSKNAQANVAKYYSWQAHCKRYIELLKSLPSVSKKDDVMNEPPAIGKRFTKLKKFFITDIDDTLLGDEQALTELLHILKERNGSIGFGVATGRRVESVLEVLKENNVPVPDVIISSVGSEIYYGPNVFPDKGWQTHISVNWNTRKIQKIMAELTFLEQQEPEAQRDFKLSYFMEESADNLAQVHRVLSEVKLRYNLVYSAGWYLDILPYRASKGKAIRYLSYKWNTALNNILVSGDSGNDADMLRGEMLGVVVGNHHTDLDKLNGLKNIYFAKSHYARGILEGMHHYKFL